MMELKRRLMETEAQMERILKAMETVQQTVGEVADEEIIPDDKQVGHLKPPPETKLSILNHCNGFYIIRITLTYNVRQDLYLRLDKSFINI